MKLSASDLSDLADIAILAALEAGQMIARSRPQEIQHKDIPDKAAGASLAAQVVTEIDRRSEDLILNILAPTLERFELGLLTEEQADDASRLTADYFWSIDPLDGTLPFIEGSPGYAVSIALVGSDGTPWVGVIYDPVKATMMHAIKGVGAFRDRRRWPTEERPRGEALSVFADRSFLASDDHDAVVDALGQIARDIGLAGLRLHATSGAVMNACGVLASPPACYFKEPKPAGGGSLWDFAATACLFHEVGAVATDIHGAALDLNRPDSSFMNHRGVLFATDDALAQRIRAMEAGRKLTMSSFDDGLPEIHPKTQAGWRSWLQKNHATCDGVWLIFYRASTGNRRLSWEDAVRQALCFGWIDSKVKPVDDERYKQIFTPRKPQSVWSKINKQHIAELTAAELMTDAGQAAVDVGKENGAWTFLEPVDALIVPPDLASGLEASNSARNAYEALSKSAKRAVLYSLYVAKREETRAKRLTDALAGLESSKSLGSGEGN